MANEEGVLSIDHDFRGENLEKLIEMRNGSVKHLAAAIADLEKIYAVQPHSSDHAEKRAWMHMETSNAVLRNIDWGIEQELRRQRDKAAEAQAEREIKIAGRVGWATVVMSLIVFVQAFTGLCAWLWPQAPR